MKAVPRLVRRIHEVRTAAFGYCFLTIGIQLWEHHAGAAAWALLVVQFLVYPHLLHWRSRRSAAPRSAERDNLLLDSSLLGAWIAYLGFPLWIAYALLASTMLNATVNRGLAGGLLSLCASAGGAALYAAIGGVELAPETSPLVTSLAFFGVLAYTCAVGLVVFRQQQRILRAREALAASESRFRLIAENAADLVAMVDSEGRWLYASPSYERVLKPDDLRPGGDAFRALHPDDAEHARTALLRVSLTGKPREMALRLVDREGRVRQFRTRVQPVSTDAAPRHRLLLVSQDVTDLRESEERTLLAHNALEGMTQGIVIISADGIVQSVNRAFTEITGIEREEAVGQHEKTIRNALQRPEFYEEIQQAVLREGYWSGTTWSRRKNGLVYREWRSVRAVCDAEGKLTHYVMVLYEARRAQRA